MFAVISDIHANLEALETVLAYLDQHDIGKIYCLGDIIGYGPDPLQVTELIKERNIVTCMGNHDAALLDPLKSMRFNPIALMAIEWTRRQITTSQLTWLSGNPYTFAREECFFVHASPAFPEHWEYISYPSQAREQFDAFSEKVCFIGHTHYPTIICEDGSSDFNSYVRLDLSKKYLINAGSVGQPRDGDPRACFLTFKPGSGEIEYIRLAYDFKKTQKKIANSDLPEYLAARLARGR